MPRTIHAYYLILLLLITNLGIPAFSHVCHGMSQSWSSLLTPPHGCCSKQKAKEHDLLCHLPLNTEGPEFSKLPCCENHNGLLRLNANFLLAKNSVQPSTDIAFQGIIVEDMTDVVYSADLEPAFLKSHGPPHHLYGRDLLIAHQVFRC